MLWYFFVTEQATSHLFFSFGEPDPYWTVILVVIVSIGCNLLLDGGGNFHIFSFDVDEFLKQLFILTVIFYVLLGKKMVLFMS